MAPFLSSRLTPTRQAVIVYPAQSGDQRAALVAALEAVAHPQRLEILRLAARGPVTRQSLARALGVFEPTVHHHTSPLRAAGHGIPVARPVTLARVGRDEEIQRLADRVRGAVAEEGLGSGRPDADDTGCVCEDGGSFYALEFHAQII
jgi:DNA-binding transcriptional ArsR family regulator